MRRYIIIAITGIVLLIAGYQAYRFFGKGSLHVQAQPQDTITIINNQYYSPSDAQDIILAPGKYQVTLVADGYITTTQEVAMGWKSDEVLDVTLKPKSFDQIIRPLMPELERVTHSIAQPKFFLDNTWAAGYVVSGTEESSVALAILERRDGKWKIVYYSNEPVNRDSVTIPDSVYEYVKNYAGE